MGDLQVVRDANPRRRLSFNAHAAFRAFFSLQTKYTAAPIRPATTK
jgi:hypothetical protein